MESHRNRDYALSNGFADFDFYGGSIIENSEKGCRIRFDETRYSIKSTIIL